MSIRNDLIRFYESADAVEAIYEETLGEETDEAKAAEAIQSMDASKALESLAAYRAHIMNTKIAVKNEQARLKARGEALKRAQAWCDSQLLAIMARQDWKKRDAGPFQIRRTQGRERVEVLEGFRYENVSPDFLRVPDMTPELDKSAAKAALKRGESIPGVRLARGPESVTVK